MATSTYRGTKRPLSNSQGYYGTADWEDHGYSETTALILNKFLCENMQHQINYKHMYIYTHFSIVWPRPAHEQKLVTTCRS